MIYTLTLNPAIDYVIHAENLILGNISRSERENIYIGGKGINVSLILRQHSIPSVATGFLAGFTGQMIREILESQGISQGFVILDEGFTRINVKIRAGQETDINARGPHIDREAMTRLSAKLEALREGDTLVLAGSVPSSLPKNIYEEIMRRLNSKHIRFVVDTTGASLLATLKYRPFLIKPNADELGEIVSAKIATFEDAAYHAAELQRMGARNVLVSMGGAGAVLLDENGCRHETKATPGKVVNTVGAGDSMVAGFLAGYEQTGDYAYALKLGEASGSATAFCEGLAMIEDIMAIINCTEQRI